MTFTEYKQLHDENTKDDHYLWDFIENLEDLINRSDNIERFYMSAEESRGFIMCMNIDVDNKHYRFTVKYSTRYCSSNHVPSLVLACFENRKEKFYISKNGWEMMQYDNPIGLKPMDLNILQKYAEELYQNREKKNES